MAHVTYYSVTLDSDGGACIDAKHLLPWRLIYGREEEEKGEEIRRGEGGEKCTDDRTWVCKEHSLNIRCNEHYNSWFTQVREKSTIF